MFDFDESIIGLIIGLTLKLFLFSLIVCFFCYISTIIPPPVPLLLFSIVFLIAALGSYYHEDMLKFLCIGLLLLFAGSYTTYLLYYVDMPTIMNKADKNIERITNYNEITDYYGDTYDLTVHELNHAKEIRYYDKEYGRSKLFNVISGGQDAAYYYRIKPDLSYERVPLKETSFDKDKE